MPSCSCCWGAASWAFDFTRSREGAKRRRLVRAETRRRGDVVFTAAKYLFNQLFAQQAGCAHPMPPDTSPPRSLRLCANPFRQSSRHRGLARTHRDTPQRTGRRQEILFAQRRGGRREGLLAEAIRPSNRSVVMRSRCRRARHLRVSASPREPTFSSAARERKAPRP